MGADQRFGPELLASCLIVQMADDDEHALPQLGGDQGDGGGGAVPGDPQQEVNDEQLEAEAQELEALFDQEFGELGAMEEVPVPAEGEEGAAGMETDGAAAGGEDDQAGAEPGADAPP